MEFGVSLVSIMGSRTARAEVVRPCLSKAKQNKATNEGKTLSTTKVPQKMEKTKTFICCLPEGHHYHV